MKQIFIKLLYAVVAISLPLSCTDFLMEKPVTVILDTDSYSTESGLEANVYGIYRASVELFGMSYYSHYYYNGSLYTEWTGTRNTSAYTQAHYYTLFSEEVSNVNIFKQYYTIINLCNTTLEGLPESPVDKKYKSQIEGEVRFLRAFHYFYLTSMYGDVPYIDYNCKSMEDACVPRTPYYKIYGHILKDLEFAFSNMRTKEEQEAITPDAGRTYNYAAKALESLVYAQMACYLESVHDNFWDDTKPERLPDFSDCGISSAEQAWEKSLLAAEKVMFDAESPYSLDPDFRHLFRFDPINFPEDYRSAERIFTLQNTPIAGNAGVTNFQNNGLNYDTLSLQGKNANSGRSRPSCSVWEKWCELYGGTKNDNGIYDMPTTDPRFDVTYIYNVIYKYGGDGAVQNTVIYPAGGNADATKNPYYKKHLTPRYNIDPGDYDLYMIRMAEIYLAAAEAANALNNKGKAIDYINALHARARNSVDGSPASEPHDLSASDFTTREDLDARIQWERIFETHGEDKGMLESHRRGAKWLVKNVIEPYNEYMNQEHNSKRKACLWIYEHSVDGQVTLEAPTDIPTVRAGLICAYPKQEIRYNTSLSDNDQNDFFIQ